MFNLIIRAQSISSRNFISKQIVNNQRSIFRFKSSLPDNFNPKRDLPSEGEWKHIKHHIPGESVQKNDLGSRVPRFPLTKEIVPTLLPRPGVPQVGPKTSFKQVLEILKRKTKPELIYEAEPHRLYFLSSICFALMFTAYGLVLLEYGVFESTNRYELNERELSPELLKREWYFDVIKFSVPGLIVLRIALAIVRIPQRLIRRMWFLPGKGGAEFIRFTSYPLFPGQATPVYTVPLSNLTRHAKAKVWTGKGFYGTADNSHFFFALKETNPTTKKTKSWIVDRKGFFWSDGRVFDVLFGKESVAEAELGVPYDEQIGVINRGVKKQRQQLREKHGFFYRYKLQGKEMKKDIGKLGKFVGEKVGIEGKKDSDDKNLLGKGKK
ncbi:hypothetical protein CLIB1423_10S00804 [[Candida] railenensis]|uniref:Uncharacterized protein n=1 Tax=[Candida] railenensis TaxID=45579 RepID=A0A9P0QQW3_9ASCO|nr:hypothetical protein CLIB1423_10S00804 [[Candida] railenensis]